MKACVKARVRTGYLLGDELPRLEALGYLAILQPREGAVQHVEGLQLRLEKVHRL